MVRIWQSSAKFRVGATIILVIVLVGVLQPQLNALFFGGADPAEIGAYGIFQPPTRALPLGTDRLGRNNLALLLLGTRFSLSVGVMAGMLATAFGIAMGFLAGYLGGWLDALMQSLTDMWLVIPSFPILVVMTVFVPKLDAPVMALLLAVFSWPFAARAIRAQVLSLRARPYVDLARISMESDLEIVFLELVPNLLPYLGLGLASSIVGAMFAQVGLEVIGLGPADATSLGMMLSRALGWGVMADRQLWHMILVPAGVLTAIFVGLNLVNIGMEEVFNPRLSAVTGR